MRDHRAGDDLVDDRRGHVVSVEVGTRLQLGAEFRDLASKASSISPSRPDTNR